MKNVIITLVILFLTGCATIKKETPVVLEYILHTPVKIGYIVKPNDCLWNIAKDVYNDPFLWPVIYRTNLDIISNPDLIEVNQILNIKINPTELENRSARFKARVYKE